jgi:ribosome-associated toxin RatA of RatAB toxin-antitoxin module
VIPRKDKSEVQFDYTKGPFSGYGIWKFEKLNHKNTRMSYEIFPSPVNLLYGMAGRTKIFRKKMKRISGILKRE